jgi:hypothetical protein
MTRGYQVVITAAVGFVLITAALIGILVQAPDELKSSNSITVAQELSLFNRHTTVCQANERLPASTAALRMSLISYIGPAVSVTVSHEGQIVATGHHAAGWVSSSLTLPLRPQVATPIDVKICLTRDSGSLIVGLLGNVSRSAFPATINGRPLPGRMRTEYLSRGHRSWLSLAKHIARRLGLGHSPSGTWIVLPLAALMAIAATLGVWLLMREQRHE